MEQIKSIEAARARDQNMSQGAPDVSFFYPFFILIFKNKVLFRPLKGSQALFRCCWRVRESSNENARSS